MLGAHEVAHVRNHWSYMPSLADQHQRMGSFTAPFTVLRLLTPLKISYEEAKMRAEPYNRIVRELPEMRRDMVDLVKKAIGEKRRAYVLVNHRAEGSAPLTIQVLLNAPQGVMSCDHSSTLSVPLSRCRKVRKDFSLRR